MNQKKNEQKIVLAFQERYWSDKAEDQGKSLADYLALYPDHQALIAREYLAVEIDDEETMVGDGSRSVDAGGHLGPYLIEKEIGRGGQGVVYLATDENPSSVPGQAPSGGRRPGRLVACDGFLQQLRS